MSDDLGDFLKEAAKRRKERRERQEGAQSRPRPVVDAERTPARSLGEGETEARQTLSGQSQSGNEHAMAELEAARYAARERRVERVGFAERSAAEAKAAEAKSRPVARTSLAATPAPMPGAFSQPQAVGRTAEIAGESDAQALLRLLRSPSGMRQAFLMAEILRPKHLDG